MKERLSIKHQIAGLRLLDNAKQDYPVLGSFLTTSVLKSTNGVLLGINVLWYFFIWPDDFLQYRFPSTESSATNQSDQMNRAFWSSLLYLNSQNGACFFPFRTLKIAYIKSTTTFSYTLDPLLKNYTPSHFQALPQLNVTFCTSIFMAGKISKY